MVSIKIVPRCKQCAVSNGAEHIEPQERASLSGDRASAAHIMNHIQGQDFFEESQGFLNGPRLALCTCKCPKNFSLSFFSIENITRVFLKSTLFKLVGKITRKILD